MGSRRDRGDAYPEIAIYCRQERTLNPQRKRSRGTLAGLHYLAFACLMLPYITNAMKIVQDML